MIDIWFTKEDRGDRGPRTSFRAMLSPDAVLVSLPPEHSRLDLVLHLIVIGLGFTFDWGLEIIFVFNDRVLTIITCLLVVHQSGVHSVDFVVDITFDIVEFDLSTVQHKEAGQNNE